MALVTLYRRDDLSGNVKADDTKLTMGDDGVMRTELENLNYLLDTKKIKV